ncbi:MAG TPA: hypothetical protein VIW80_12980 [Pyrinomonadaceae bacterium]
MNRRNKAVAALRDGLDVARLAARVVERQPNPVDALAQAVLGYVIALPDGLPEYVLVDHLAGVLDEQEQHVEILRQK